MSFGARALIRLGALSHNLQLIRKTAPGSHVMAVIKANAYGHGLLTIANGLPEADSFAVARLQEASELRSNGITKPIVLLAGVYTADELRLAVELDCELVVHCEPQIELLEDADADGVTVWMKLDSGMRRLGFALGDATKVQERLGDCKSVREIRLMTHLASADRRTEPTTTEQLAALGNAVPEFDGDVSIANSAATFAWTDELEDYYSRCTGTPWLRAGICLYGISPFTGQTGADLGLRPVMEFESRLISVKKISAGESVGYLGRWQAQKDTTIGIVAAGYGDGYLRFIPSGTPMLINGRRVPVAGVISMDMTAVDLGEDALERVGDAVTLWGEDLPVEEIAAHAGTIPYQLLTGVTHREHSQRTE